MAHSALFHLMEPLEFGISHHCMSPLAMISTIIVIITLPYTLCYYSRNWGMNKRYVTPVQLFLDHFERLYTPNLFCLSLKRISLRQKETRQASSSGQ